MAARKKAARKSAPRKQAPAAAPPAAIRSAPPGDRFRPAEEAVCAHALSFPEVSEAHPWGHRAFKVNKKGFLYTGWDDGVFSISVKLPESAPIALMQPYAEPTGYGMGRSGWVTARFSGKDKVPVGILCAWVEESYRAIAPKKLVAKLG
jgi:predicted DNA-binding protein (MmcQ/YjbR family)